jgi:hypothetical protein
VFTVNASELRKLGSRLRKTQPEVYREIRRAVLEEAKIIADDARRSASWSAKIPGSIKVSTTGINTAVVRAGGKNAPAGAPFEHAGKSGTFRHPVPGTNTWVTQEARPFLHPAALSRLPATVERLGLAVVTAVDRAINSTGG